jgi:hypothetical protein
VRYQSNIVLDEEASTQANFFDIEAILIEYVSGPTLEYLGSAVPQQYWTTIIERARKVVQAYDSLDFCNTDVAARNFVIQKPPHGDEDWSNVRVVMIDLGHSKIRSPERSDRQWGRTKYYHHEESKVYSECRWALREVGHEFEYEGIEKWEDYAQSESSGQRSMAASQRKHEERKARATAKEKARVATLECVMEAAEKAEKDCWKLSKGQVTLKMQKT